jgi:plasmid stabilization system protein ParE
VIRVDFTSEAAEEVQSARDWYAEQSFSAALSLVDEVAAAIERIRESPHRWPKAVAGTRRLLAHRFPFVIYHRTIGRTIRVVALAHAKRKPGHWRDRIRRRKK